MSDIGVIDIFSGPGGLGEGFAEYQPATAEADDGAKPFKLVLSVEKDVSAHKTLLFRSFLRKFDNKPDEYYDHLNGEISMPELEELYPKEWSQAVDEVWHNELGQKDTWSKLQSRIRKIKKQYDGRTILLGGPPCQAYSLVGRPRNASKIGYDLEKDDRTYLYKEYVKVLSELEPAAFVMENVKGLLSFKTRDGLIGQQILRDLEGEGYRLFPLSKENGAPTDQGLSISDFVVKSEDFGIPQRRHRVIIVGIRKDLVSKSGEMKVSLKSLEEQISVRSVIGNLPTDRSRLSRNDNEDNWIYAFDEGIEDIEAGLKESQDSSWTEGLLKRLQEVKDRYIEESCKFGESKSSGGNGHTHFPPELPGDLRDWIIDKDLSRLLNHEARSHMPSDLARYLFAAIFSEVEQRSPKAQEFPDQLAPNHKNWGTGYFSDRFCVQEYDKPARTITSHIAKDGHYYIHPDPFQCRSLTVREAARLQTFPDNYLFLGNRTQQYTQVGNAVPPFLARQIAEVLWKALY